MSLVVNMTCKVEVGKDWVRVCADDALDIYGIDIPRRAYDLIMGAVKKECMLEAFDGVAKKIDGRFRGNNDDLLGLVSSCKDDYLWCLEQGERQARNREYQTKVVEMVGRI